MARQTGGSACLTVVASTASRERGAEAEMEADGEQSSSAMEGARERYAHSYGVRCGRAATAEQGRSFRKMLLFTY